MVFGHFTGGSSEETAEDKGSVQDASVCKKAVREWWQSLQKELSKDDSVKEGKTFLLEMYDANFMVGDIYETYALVTFGNLVMGVVNKKIEKMEAVFEDDIKDRKDGGEMKEYIEKLVQSMSTLTVAGVKLFAMSCLLQGVYTIIITTCAFDFPDFMPHLFSRTEGSLGVFQQPAIKATAHNFFLGAGFIASFAAIGNIMIIETDYHHLLHEFKPAPKFWGTKILVSLAFLQSILISVFLSPNGWSEIQTDLLYSSCLCLEIIQSRLHLLLVCLKSDRAAPPCVLDPARTRCCKLDMCPLSTIAANIRCGTHAYTCEVEYGML